MLTLALLMLLSSASAAEQAGAATNPSIDQYVERVPSSGGDRDPRGRDRSGGGGVSPEVRRRIQADGGVDAPQLEEIVSSPALGAPDGTARGGRDEESRRGSGGSKADGSRSGSASEGSRPTALEAVVTAGGHDTGSSFGWLIAGIVALSAAMAAAALARRRSSQRGP